MQRAMS